MAIKSFTCPNCHKKQDRLRVTSVCSQTLNFAGDDWTDLEVGDSLYVYCLECGQQLPKIYQRLKNEGIISGLDLK